MNKVYFKIFFRKINQIVKINVKYILFLVKSLQNQLSLHPLKLSNKNNLNEEIKIVFFYYFNFYLNRIQMKIKKI